MALAKVTILDKVEALLEFGIIQVRHATFVTEDGVRISEPQYHRAVYTPVDTIPANAEKEIKDIAAVVRTPEKTTAYIDFLKKNQPSASPVGVNRAE